MWLLANNIHGKILKWCITQSGKNYAINCAIQGVRLIWKQKIWLATCKFLWSMTNQNAWFVSFFFCTELTLSCTVFEKNCTALNQSKWRNYSIIKARKRERTIHYRIWGKNSLRDSGKFCENFENTREINPLLSSGPCDYIDKSLCPMINIFNAF